MMRREPEPNSTEELWGPYPNWNDLARFEYARRFWVSPPLRTALLAHWLDQRHPGAERFRQRRGLIEEVLGSPLPPEQLDQELRRRGTSLRCVAREIPPVFGSYFRWQL